MLLEFRRSLPIQEFDLYVRFFCAHNVARRHNVYRNSNASIDRALPGPNSNRNGSQAVSELASQQTWHENKTTICLCTWFAKNHTSLTVISINWISYIIMCYAFGLWRSLAGAEFREIFFETIAKFDILMPVFRDRKSNISFFVYIRWDTFFFKNPILLYKWFRTIFCHAKPNKELRFIFKLRLYFLYCSLHMPCCMH